MYSKNIWNDGENIFYQNEDEVETEYKEKRYILYTNGYLQELSKPTIDILLKLNKLALEKIKITKVEEEYMVDISLKFDTYYSSESNETQYNNIVSSFRIIEINQKVIIESYKGTSICLSRKSNIEEVIQHLSNLNSFEIVDFLNELISNNEFN
jgi:hypothetical protein